VCEPTLILTGASTALSAAGGLAGAASEKKASVNNYKRQLAIREIEWDRSRSEYAHKVTQAEEQLDENFLAASRGFGAEQMQLNALFDQASVEFQNDFTKLMEDRKFYGTGKTAERLRSRDLAAFGRSQALTASNLVRAREGYDRDVTDIRQQLKSANRKTLAPVQFKPQPGLPPVKPNTDMTAAYLGAVGTIAGGASDIYSQGLKMDMWGSEAARIAAKGY